MTQHEINHAVAIATGEPISTVTQMGFTIADPDLVDHDPEPCDIEDLIVDWDALDARRNTPLVPAMA